ncbi:Afadin and alpha-actinin-binding-domain-containing protein [Astrocystis sublimbata]|nr:Afadin and alpha-actinin-binding-domain-containing protein [Astrocystis sublimbata]
MIDPENLRTASLYINNQLLSRGLLRDGQTIDFADPEGSDGGLQYTMGRVISVVNDLILRRDRDAEHRESLSTTLRTLRADYQRQTTEFGRQTERLGDTQRQVDIAEATERSLRAQVKTAELGIAKLKEEMAKMKSLVAQTRSACANEVRKRDRQIDTLKKAIADAGRVRGGARNRDIITISITGEFGGEGDNNMGLPVGATDTEGYNLSMETNGFLTALAKGLSEENEGLLALVRRTVDGLREMSGLERDTDFALEHHGSLQVREVIAMQPPHKSAEELASELEAIVEHLRSILTNPSFVPIEEVEVRDEVITRLRAGLETMEARWKDAVYMIDGWRKRMVSSGKSVDMDDLQMGLRLSPVRVRDVVETANIDSMRLSCVQEAEEVEEEEDEEVKEEEKVADHPRQDAQPQSQPQPQPQPHPQRFGSRSPESVRLVSASYDEVQQPVEDDLGDDLSESESSIFQDDDDLEIDDLDVDEPNVQILQTSTASNLDNSSPLPEPPQLSPLKDSYSSGNRGAGTASPYRKRAIGDFTTILEENTQDLAPVSAPTSHPASPTGQKEPSIKLLQSPVVTDEDDLPSYTASYDSPLFGKSGERRSSNRKLFSKQPALGSSAERCVKNTARGRGDKKSPAPQPLTRTTRSAANKSNGNDSPTVGHFAGHAISGTSHSSKPAGAVPKSASSSPKPTSTLTAARNQNQALAAGPTQQRTASGQSSTSNSSTSSSENKPTSNRSPTRPVASTSAGSASSSASSRLPRRGRLNTQQARNSPGPLNMATIAAKLAASEREADAARVRAKLRAVRRRGGRRSGGAYQRLEDDTKQEGEEKENQGSGSINVDPVKQDCAMGSPMKKSPLKSASPVKSPLKKGPRRRWSRGDVGKDEIDELALEYDAGHNHGNVATEQSGNAVENVTDGRADDDEQGEQDDAPTPLRVPKRNRRAPMSSSKSKANKAASRRRSTLSPWELQGLITGSVGGAESPVR